MKGHGVPVEKCTRGYSRVFKTKMRLKGNECSSELMELNIVCAVGEERRVWP